MSRNDELILVGLLALWVEQRETRRRVDALLALSTASPFEADALKKRIVDRLLDVPLNLVLP